MSGKWNNSMNGSMMRSHGPVPVGAFREGTHREGNGHALHAPVLVLNASYEPINVCAARRAIVLVLKGVAMTEEENGHFLHAARLAIRVPSVIRLLEYRRIPHQTRALSRKNILLRLVRGLRLVLLARCLLHFLPFIGDLHVRSKSFVVAVLHDLADLHVAAGKVQSIIGFRIGGEPILAVDLLAPGSELGKKILLSFLLANVRDGFAEGFHDLKIAVIDPDAALKIALLADDFLGSNVENIAMQFVLLLLADIENLIFRDFVGGEHER